MPTGKRISSESRLTMYNLHCEGWSQEDIFHVLFSNDTTRIPLDHIVNRCRFFASSEGEVIAKYIIGTEEQVLEQTGPRRRKAAALPGPAVPRRRRRRHLPRHGQNA